MWLNHTNWMKCFVFTVLRSSIVCKTFVRVIAVTRSLKQLITLINVTVANCLFSSSDSYDIGIRMKSHFSCHCYSLVIHFWCSLTSRCSGGRFNLSVPSDQNTFQSFTKRFFFICCPACVLSLVVREMCDRWADKQIVRFLPAWKGTHWPYLNSC